MLEHLVYLAITIFFHHISRYNNYTRSFVSFIQIFYNISILFCYQLSFDMGIERVIYYLFYQVFLTFTIYHLTVDVGYSTPFLLILLPVLPSFEQSGIVGGGSL